MHQNGETNFIKITTTTFELTNASLNFKIQLNMSLDCLKPQCHRKFVTTAIQNCTKNIDPLKILYMSTTINCLNNYLVAS